MKKILLIGAGRSASTLIKYLLDNAEKENWFVNIGEMDVELAKKKINNHPRAAVFSFDVNNETLRTKAVQENDLVISMLPAHMHVPVAKDCVIFKKHMVTASYVSDAMKALDEDAKKNGVILMNEIGVDPGIDHMSAMKIIDELKHDGFSITHFESFTGGLIAPESDNNPWHYKFTWNPRNVVLAGQGGVAKFIIDGVYKYIPYHKLFSRFDNIHVEGYGNFEGYANRDSLKYREVYGLENIPTIYRGTLRGENYCSSWDLFVQLGMTDDGFTIENSEDMTYREFVQSFLPGDFKGSLEENLMNYFNMKKDSIQIKNFIWLGIMEERKIGLKNATPAQIVQQILEEKWKLEANDKDMLVMWHKFGYEKNGKKHFKESCMVNIGDDQTHTAMSKTVGLPVAIATKMILNRTIKATGVQLPISKEIYTPILKELESFGIVFKEREF